MSPTYFIHVMGALRPRHVLRHCWPLENFQGFVRRFPPFHFLITFGLQSLTLHESRRVQKFKAKKKCYILLTSHDHLKVERNISILKWSERKENFKGFLKVFLLIMGVEFRPRAFLRHWPSAFWRPLAEPTSTNSDAEDTRPGPRFGHWSPRFWHFSLRFWHLSPRFWHLSPQFGHLSQRFRHLSLRLEHMIWVLKSKIWALESKIEVLESKFRKLDSKNWALESNIWALEP